MNNEILISCCIIAVMAVLMNLKALGKNPYISLKIIVSLLVSLTSLRYITLIVYGNSAEYHLLYVLRYFYFMSSIGVTMTTVSAIWYITPCYREKISYPYFLACFLPWILFYLYLILKQPTQIIQGSQFGYQLILKGKFPFYLSIAQSSFVIIAMTLCLIGILSYKHLQMRCQLFMIILAQFLLALDSISYQKTSLRIFPPFTLTEAFAFFGTYYALAKSVRMIHALKNQ